MKDETKFHWGEGMKYALEGMKTLLILNGGAAVSILTFAGNNMKILDNSVILAMVSFALGALMSVFVFVCAYLTQLEYGNSHVSEQIEINWRKAHWWHNATYIIFVIGITFFVSGIGLTAYGLWY